MAAKGIFLVNSGITAKETLDLETFTRWYEGVHIPDLLKTSGVNTAYRFQATAESPKPDDIVSARPFLALYPIEDIAWAADANSELWQVPVHHEMLPNESKNAFELAEFQMGGYANLGSIGGQGSGPAKSIVVASVSQEEVASGVDSDFNALLRDSITIDGSDAPAPIRSTLFKWTCAPPGFPSPAETAPGKSLIESYLIIVSTVSWEILLMDVATALTLC